MRLLLVLISLTFLFGCVKSFTDNPDRPEPVGDNADMLDRSYVTFDKNGDTLKVADSAPRMVNGVKTMVATGKPRIQMHNAPDSSMRIWPNAATVKGWLTLSDYYNWKLPLAIFFFALIPVAWFGFGKQFERFKKGAGWAMFAFGAIFAYLSYVYGAQQPRVMSEQNSKVIPIEEYRKQKKDNFVHFWDSLKVNNRVIRK